MRHFNPSKSAYGSIFRAVFRSIGLSHAAYRPLRLAQRRRARARRATFSSSTAPVDNVDVTDHLLREFTLNEKQRKTVAELRAVKRLPLHKPEQLMKEGKL